MHGSNKLLIMNMTYTGMESFYSNPIFKTYVQAN